MSRITYRHIAQSLMEARMQMVQLALQTEAEGDAKGARALLAEQRQLANYVHVMDGRIIAALTPRLGESQ
ncbi:hypothetical protein [Salinicola tamaricis]|uniref:hypothetical protein n=1 Tax=Salinicola tamaricis TaxID=1771309 RepID=UPI000D099FF2|nr:hypothetical protein [Salinicola tamaricis]